jgi:diguanylate cyclase (GGDEF)-like protein
MPEKIIARALKSHRTANSLTQVLGKNERVQDIVEECADELSTVNARLKRELRDGDSSPGVENALEKSEAVEGKVQDASEALIQVNRALKDEVQERTLLQERLAAEIRLGDEARHASLHDPLTGLPNRALFNDRLDHDLAHAKRNGHSLVLMFLDLDNFKTVNDTHGHDVGDVVLTTIAGRLKHASRDEDTVCRQGGDEFLYLLVDIKNERDIRHIAEKIIALVKQPCAIRIRDLDISLIVEASIGIAIYPADGMAAEVLLAHADKAMYQAKRKGAGYALFTATALSQG